MTGTAALGTTVASPVTEPGAVRRALEASLVLRVGALSVRLRRRPLLVGLALLAVLAGAVVASLSLGEHPIAVARVARTLLGQGSPADELVVAGLRLPRVLAGALAGVALGAAGAVFQSVTRNPLGSPDVIGFDTGASTGALVAMLVLPTHLLSTSAGALAGGALTAAAVYALAARGGVAPLRLVLVGIGAGSLLASVNSLLIVRAQLYDAQSASVWLVGNLAGRGWDDVALLAPAALVGIAAIGALTAPLVVGELADDRATSLGQRPARLRLVAVTLGVLVASASVATAGPVPFVALAAPQVARRLTQAPGPHVLTGGLVGAVLLVLADLAAREAFQPRQLPVGVLTGVAGGAYLAWLLAAQRRKGRT